LEFHKFQYSLDVAVRSISFQSLVVPYQILSEIKETAATLQELVDVATDEWGVKVTRVEIKDIKIPDDMKRAMAIEAEAERERRAMVIRASGEQEAAQQLAEAAKVLDQTASGFQVRYLETLLQVAEAGNTVVFADPKLGGTALGALGAKRERMREVEATPDDT